MSNKSSLLSLALAYALASIACGGGEPSAKPNSIEDSASMTTTPEEGSSREQPRGDSPAPFSREFDGLVEQAVPWSGLEVQVTGARLYRGERPEELAPLISFSPASVYAVLDIQVTQLANAETDYTERDTWDLILADGARLRPINALGLRIVTGDSPTARLYYRAEEDTDLAGAVLELNGSERATLEPALIPLDVRTTFESHVELIELIGQTIEPQGAGELSFEVLEATYGVNLPELSVRAPIDKRLLALTTRVGYSGNFSESFNSVDDGPKVSVNGNTIESREGDIDTISSGDTIDFLTIYEIDEGTVSLEILFDTQDETIARVPVALPAL